MALSATGQQEISLNEIASLEKMAHNSLLTIRESQHSMKG
jgi:hypothetical protein